MNRKRIAQALLVVGLGAAVFFGYPVVQNYLVAKRNGFLDPVEREGYAPTTQGNLKAIHTALMLYADSEGQFPEGSGWMDAIENRLQTNKLKAGEGLKKLRSPRFSGDSEYGYALNPACAAKYPGDIREPNKTILVFDTEESKKNASADPSSGLKGGLGITVSGDVVELPK